METTSPETGPRYDHTHSGDHQKSWTKSFYSFIGSKNGFYIFIEASSPRFKGDNALLISPPVQRESTSSSYKTQNIYWISSHFVKNFRKMFEILVSYVWK